jgi:argininosuccinate lyase
MLDMIKSTQNNVQIATGVLRTLAVDPEKMKASFEYVSILGT